MKKFAYTINLKDDAALIQKYKEHHQKVWPEVIKSLKEVGILSMNIYLIGRKMFMVMEVVDDFKAEIDFPRYLTLNPKCQVWEDLMGNFQEVAEEAKEGEKWALMEEVFDINW